MTSCTQMRENNKCPRAKRHRGVHLNKAPRTMAGRRGVFIARVHTEQRHATPRRATPRRTTPHHAAPCHAMRHLRGGSRASGENDRTARGCSRHYTTLRVATLLARHVLNNNVPLFYHHQNESAFEHSLLSKMSNRWLNSRLN